MSWLLQKSTDLDLHCLQRQGNPGSAGQGLNIQNGGSHTHKYEKKNSKIQYLSYSLTHFSSPVT